MQNHRNLEIWRRSCSLCVSIRAATERFPRRGYAELREQVISAAESMAHTIAEGCGAETQKEFARFLGMTIKSANEVEGELDLAHDYGVIADERYRALVDETVAIRQKTFALRKKVLAADAEAEAEKKRRASAKRRRPENSDNAKRDTRNASRETP